MHMQGYYKGTVRIDWLHCGVLLPWKYAYVTLACHLCWCVCTCERVLIVCVVMVFHVYRSLLHETS